MPMTFFPVQSIADDTFLDFARPKLVFSMVAFDLRHVYQFGSSIKITLLDLVAIELLAELTCVWGWLLC